MTTTTPSPSPNRPARYTIVQRPAPEAGPQLIEARRWPELWDKLGDLLRRRAGELEGVAVMRDMVPVLRVIASPELRDVLRSDPSLMHSPPGALPVGDPDPFTMEAPHVEVSRDGAESGSGRWDQALERVTDCPADLGEEVWSLIDEAIGEALAGGGPCSTVAVDHDGREYVAALSATCPGCGRLNSLSHAEGAVDGPREYHAGCCPAVENEGELGAPSIEDRAAAIVGEARRVSAGMVEGSALYLVGAELVIGRDGCQPSNSCCLAVRAPGEAWPPNWSEVEAELAEWLRAR